MFTGYTDAAERAEKIADYLSNHREFKSHGRHVSRDKAKELGLNIENLENDQELQDLVLSVFHATTHTFNGTTAVKIIENHNGKAFIKVQQTIPIQLPPPQAPPPKQT